MQDRRFWVTWVRRLFPRLGVQVDTLSRVAILADRNPTSERPRCQSRRRRLSSGVIVGVVGHVVKSVSEEKVSPALSLEKNQRTSFKVLWGVERDSAFEASRWAYIYGRTDGTWMLSRRHGANVFIDCARTQMPHVDRRG